MLTSYKHSRKINLSRNRTSVRQLDRDTINRLTMTMRESGSLGNTGSTGPTGPIGPIGPVGMQGNKGPDGDTGPTGPTGPAGNGGIMGLIGSGGDTGIKGDTGPTGTSGAQGPQGLPGVQGVVGITGPYFNPKRIGVKRNYLVNKSFTSHAYLTGGQIRGMTFDGEVIWGANWAVDSIFRFNIKTQTFLAAIPTYNQPIDLAFDGTNVWVSMELGSNPFGPGELKKIRASDGAILATYALSIAGGGAGVEFDGSNIWYVSNSPDNFVKKVRVSDGAVLATVSVGSGPFGVLFDGTSIWVTNYNSNSVTKINPIAATVIGTYAVGTNPRDLGFDGINIWVANANSTNATVLAASTGALVTTLALPGFNQPHGFTFDGKYMWATGVSNSQIAVIDPTLPITPASITDNFSLGFYNGPWGMIFDGNNIWVGTDQGSIIQL